MFDEKGVLIDRKQKNMKDNPIREDRRLCYEKISDAILWSVVDKTVFIPYRLRSIDLNAVFHSYSQTIQNTLLETFQAPAGTEGFVEKT